MAIGIGSSIAGALTGLLGTGLTSVFGFLNEKQKNKQELAMAQENNNHALLMVEAKIKETEAEAKMQFQKIQLEGDIQMELAAQKSFDLSQELGNQRAVDQKSVDKLMDYKWTRWLGALLIFLLAIGDVLRVYMRPAITITLMLITAVITMKHLQILDGNIDLVTADGISYIIDSILYLTFSAVSWWMGDRSMSRYMGRKKNLDNK